YVVVLIVICLLSACSSNLTSKESVVNLYTKNEALFIDAASKKSFSDLEKINGVQKVLVWDNYVDIQCGGSGFGSSTHYYGIFFSEDDDLCAVDVAGPLNELVEDGNGYRYEQSDGDNEYYVEPLENHYYYYEAHF
ncbi:MAG: hypothetical protein IJU18_00235, partial [Oscillospiraceae bacterium]|nr:hypothetical protein [Oscillospiraceae bacterium]